MTGSNAAPVVVDQRASNGSFADLRALINALPVPTAPPTFPQKEAALGLALMDLSLRLTMCLASPST